MQMHVFVLGKVEFTMRFGPSARWFGFWACWALPARQKIYIMSERKRS